VQRRSKTCTWEYRTKHQDRVPWRSSQSKTTTPRPHSLGIPHLTPSNAVRYQLTTQPVNAQAPKAAHPTIKLFKPVPGHPSAQHEAISPPWLSGNDEQI
jgi:hypothetical protein